ncbi:monoheme cytochrome C [Campylobacter jejuni]|uniref:sulfite:cytochrome c oxidoreductase monoheme cytochrome C subunit n=1 Tax=Campylobacter jejuni TaxID=197 RepID=UPI0008735B84|nr:monoheme cytochrome C [Campylobacter jejuni]ECL3339826.1 monoheme cytochrome C [Campylobacter jejuni]ECQ9841773.1 monoheme cytochrome C [Campylobacter jejuni]EJV6777225.1 monoheme cytochrome C [Campylobacter jejuni]OEY60221.1 cytochrome C [Campylobacter jejuni]HEF2602249.1 monoheme cytochrome C [Campylobacter jejuni]
MKKIILILALFLSASWAQNLEINPDTGLIINPDSPLVEANCLACHGSNLITNMHASRKAWLAAIRWMQDSEGLWEIEPEDEEKILNYLEKYYGEKYDTRRRIPLAILLQNKTH